MFIWVSNLVTGGLRHLNQHLDPSVHLRAGEILRELDVSFDFGFMLLEPWSTVASVRNNLRFLREFAGDGATPISFCRTLPYAGTPLETKLKAEGRLIARDFSADYRFLDPRLDIFYDWTLDAFSERNHSSAGTANLLQTYDLRGSSQVAGWFAGANSGRANRTSMFAFESVAYRYG